MNAVLTTEIEHSKLGFNNIEYRSLIGAATITPNKRRMNRLKKRSYLMPLASSRCYSRGSKPILSLPGRKTSYDRGSGPKE